MSLPILAKGKAMFSDIYTTISKPFKTPMSGAELALWVVIYAIIAFALYDMLRILASFLEHAVTE